MDNWYGKFKKTAQIEGEDGGLGNAPQRMARYRGIMIYEVRVPAGEKSAEQAAAKQAADDLYGRVFGAVGDEVFSCDPPEFYGHSPR